MKAVNEFEFRNEMDKMETTVRNLSYHKKIQYFWIWILGVSAFLAILFVVYYVHTNRRLRQSNQSLYQKTLNAIKTEDSNFELRKENEELRSRISALTSKEADPSESADKRTKYSYSQLDEERKEDIQHKIETVMATDRDVFSQDLSVASVRREDRQELLHRAKRKAHQGGMPHNGRSLQQQPLHRGRSHGSRYPVAQQFHRTLQEIHRTDPHSVRTPDAC